MANNHSSSYPLLILGLIVIVLYPLSTFALCPRILPKKGMDLVCSGKNGTVTPCTLRSETHSLAQYKCKKYFSSDKPGGWMKCDKKGRWRHSLLFRKFKCHLTASGWMSQVIDQNRVVIFSLSYCRYCHQVKEIFANMKQKYFAIELDLVDDKKAQLLKEALYRRTGMKSYPNVFISGRHVGGFDKTSAHHHHGTLPRLLDGSY